MPEPIEPTRSAAGDVKTRTDSHAMFAGPVDAASRQLSLAPIVIAAIAVLLLIAVLVGVGRRHAPAAAANALQPAAAYAAQLHLGGIQLSESTNFAGGKETFVDGKIVNGGTATVTGVSVQVVFAPDGGGTPQLETVPLTLVRARQPYVDVQPVSAAPLAPGASADFRLTFDDVRPEWNQETPEIRVVSVATK